MNPFMLLSGAIMLILMGFATGRFKEMSSSLVAGGLVLLWVGISVLTGH